MSRRKKEAPVRPDLSQLAEAWGHPLVPRDQISEFTGGIFTPKYMANLAAKNSKKKGPPFFRIGRRAVYKADDVVQWLEALVVEQRIEQAKQEEEAKHAA